MSSETEIANAALRLIGADRITGLSDGSENANRVSDVYESVRDDLLRSHPWNFATKRARLPKSTTDPAFEFDNAFILPSDWLRTISVHDNDAGVGTVVCRNEQVGGQLAIVASVDNIYLRYVSKVTDPNLMSADFRRAFIVSLARDLSVPIASSNTMQDSYAKEAMRVIARARSSDAMGGFPERRPRGSWASSRGGTRNYDFESD